MKLNEEKLETEKLEQVTGGIVTRNPEGSSDTENKYFVKDDQTGEVLGTTGGYRTARKLAEQMGQSPELQ